MAAIQKIMILLMVLYPVVIHPLYIRSGSFADNTLNDDDVTDKNGGPFKAAYYTVIPPYAMKYIDVPRPVFTSPIRGTYYLMDLFPEAQLPLHEDNSEGQISCTYVVMLNNKLNTGVLIFDFFNKDLYISIAKNNDQYVYSLVKSIISSEKDYFPTHIGFSFDPTIDQISKLSFYLSKLPNHVVEAMTHFYVDFRLHQASTVKQNVDVPYFDAYMGSYGCNVDVFYNATHFIVEDSATDTFQIILCISAVLVLGYTSYVLFFVALKRKMNL